MRPAMGACGDRSVSGVGGGVENKERKVGVGTEGSERK